MYVIEDALNATSLLRTHYNGIRKLLLENNGEPSVEAASEF